MRRAAEFRVARIPKYLGYFERVLAANGGARLVGADLSYADLMVLGRGAFQPIETAALLFPQAGDGMHALIAAAAAANGLPSDFFLHPGPPPHPGRGPPSRPYRSRRARPQRGRLPARMRAGRELRPGASGGRGPSSLPDDGRLRQEPDRGSGLVKLA
ncbi:glutathione S-transferase family protein [Methylobacterium radiotolerans]|uniref:glutathione S-transferase family protein n=1 Tax=Methylobacterium radiotolerans TaxID=31998 RepID=UPI003AF7563F